MNKPSYTYEIKDTFFVALKVLLRDKNMLLITHDIFGDWDIPGGRIKPDEFDTSFEDIIKRKITEELGEKVKYELQEPKVFFRHERIEDATNQPVRIFAIGFSSIYKSGDIVLGDHHDEYRWVDVKSFEPTEYFKGGWLKGILEYKQLAQRGLA